jgi:hypothetical protein
MAFLHLNKIFTSGVLLNKTQDNFGKVEKQPVGITIRFGMDGPGIESWWGRDFPHPSRPTMWPTQPTIQCVPGFFRGLSGRSVALITHII